MLRQSRSRPTTPSRFSSSSLNNNNISETKKDDRSSERRSSHSLTRSPMVLKPSHWSREMKEVTLITKKDGVFNFRIVGGSDHGEFPVISEVMPPDTRGVEYSGSRDITTQVNKYFIICWRLQHTVKTKVNLICLELTRRLQGAWLIGFAHLLVLLSQTRFKNKGMIID